MIFINFCFMCFIFGTTFLAIKIGIDSGLTPFFSGGVRFFLAGFLIFSFMSVRNKHLFQLLFRKELFFSGVGLTFGTFSTLYWAEQYVTSGIAAVLSATGPMMIIFIQSFLLRQKATIHSVFGCAIGIIGVLLLVQETLSMDMSTFWLAGCVAILIGEVFYAAGTIYTRKVTEIYKEASPIALNAVQMMYGGFLLLVVASFTEDIQISAFFHPESAGSLIYLIIAGSMIGHSLYYWLVSKTNPVFPSTWLYISPIIALALGVLLYGEHFTIFTGLGAVTIIFGIILINYQTLRNIFSARRSLIRNHM
ncbi:DMT family transporter [Metabacillus halosaccharovorans]|uniref:EamA family transporter n=1 Tax=Metabacillus halosaccharovorans TaxID=930124 RepID=A0ABT3DIY4_9BACI|nr:EamA family transporter [Metabacillus halosaccharovorans]MCV9887010.1 EamA family transporter [Metabacillus halosaccharovorans]